MKKIFTMMFIIGSLLLSSCSDAATPVSPTEDPATIIGWPAWDMGQSLVECIVGSDYTGFIEFMDQTMKDAMTEDTFVQIQALLENRIGTYDFMEMDHISLDQGYYVVEFKIFGDIGDTTMRLVLQTTSPYLITGLWFPD